MSDEQVLTGYVWVHDGDGAHHAFGPGDTVPAWARSQVGAHLLAHTAQVPTDDAFDVLIREEIERMTDEQASLVAPAPDLPPAPGSTFLTPPPAAGPGASRTAWASYARDLGVTVGDSWTRADIQDACERVASER